MDRKTPTLEPQDGWLRYLRVEPPHPESDSMPSKRAWRPRRWLLWLVLALLGVTVLPVMILSVVPAWTSSFMVGYQVDRVFSEQKLPPLRHDWVNWDEIAPAAKLAVIAAEDQRFADHFGFDVQAIGKALQHNRTHRRKRGASTITQQTAKNLFLWSGRSWVRKGLEVGYTLLIEGLWSKQRVLEVYLNVAEFGTGVYGVEAAAQHYFRKSAAKLTYHEAALLAAVLPNPKRLKVAAPSGYVQHRAAWIRGQMNQLGTATLDAL